MTTNFLDEALNYADMGFAIFPVVPYKKNPWTAHGVKDATRDKNQIRKWWTQCPNANIGIATGQPSGGIFVLDLDSHNESQDGYQAFHEWERENNVNFPEETLLVDTAGGGYHFYFRTNRHNIGNKAGILYGVDIRGDGGYVLAPPSIVGDRRYEWEQGPDEYEIQNADAEYDKLVELTHKESTEDSGALFEMPDRIPAGERNDTLFKAASSYQSRRLSDYQVRILLHEDNRMHCDPPLPDDEVDRIIESVRRYPKGTSEEPKKYIPATDDPSGHEHLQPELLIDEKKKIPLQITDNVSEVLRYDQGLAGIIRWNSLTYTSYIFGQLPWMAEPEQREWTNTDLHNLYAYIEGDFQLKSRQKIDEALDIVVHEQTFNPIEDELVRLHSEWDGKHGHIENLLPDYLGVEKTQYTTECMTLLMEAAICRIYHPGCKYDYMVVLIGEQGIGKSTFFKRLALDEQWYDGNFNTVDGDKAVERLRGKWFLEMAELLATKRAKDVESIKAFLTTDTDTYRQPYAPLAEHRPRMCVFVGTTNDDQFLTDKTGNRRFLPLTTRKGHIQKDIFADDGSVEAEIRQAWGEAMDIFRQAGEKPKLTLSPEAEKVARQEQERFTAEDSRVGMIQEWLDNTPHRRVCSRMIFDEVFDGQPASQSVRETREIATIMSNSITGWVRVPRKVKCGNYGSVRCYERVAEQVADIEKSVAVDEKSNQLEIEDEGGFVDVPDDLELPFG